MQVHEQHTATTMPTTTRSALRWLVTFIGFPLGGLVAELVAGPVDALTAALIGGAITGAILGSVQAGALRPNRVPAGPWIGATTAGLTVGLGVGAAVVDYGTTMGDLAVQGAICGLAIGIAQSMVLRDRVGGLAFLWVPMLTGLWALGWTVTTAIGVDVESQYTVFGSSGAITVTILTAAMPLLLARRSQRSAS